MATEKNIPNLTINKVENQDVFDYLANHGLVNENELYLIPGENSGVQDVIANNYGSVVSDGVAHLHSSVLKDTTDGINTPTDSRIPTGTAVINYVENATTAYANTLKTYFYNRNNSTNTWFKVATTTITKTASQWPENHAFLFIKGSHNSNYNQNGIIAIDAVGNGQSGKIGSYEARFMSATSSLDLENFYIEYLNGDSSTDGIVNFWIRANSNNYASWQIKILQNSGWKIASSSASVTAMPSTGYTGKNATLTGSVARSIGDKNGNDITTTYYLASNPKGYTTNTGTITGITMNGSSKGTSGVVDLGTVITSHQDISGKVNKTGDTMTGALNFANNVANKVGDDVSIGDFNKSGLLGVMGQNGTTGIALIKNGSAWSASSERAEIKYNSTDKCIEFVFA